MSDDNPTTIRLAPGDMFRLEGLNWLVVAWVTDFNGICWVQGRPNPIPTLYSGVLSVWPHETLKKLLS